MCFVVACLPFPLLISMKLLISISDFAKFTGKHPGVRPRLSIEINRQTKSLLMYMDY